MNAAYVAISTHPSKSIDHWTLVDHILKMNSLANRYTSPRQHRRRICQNWNPRRRLRALETDNGE